MTEAPARAAARNTLALLASRVVVAVLGWAGSILVARALSPQAWGEFSFVFGVLGLLSIITDLGVGRVVLARLVEADDDEVALVASSFIALRVALGLLGYAVAVAVAVLGGYPGAVVRATALGGLVVVVATPSHALTVLFQSRLRLTVVALTQALGQAAQLLATVVAVLLAPVLLVLVLPAVLNEVVQLVGKVRAVRAGAAGPLPSWPVQLRRWRGMLAEAAPVTLGTALFDLTYRVDVLMLSRLDTFTAVGLYSVGFKFADALELVAYAVLSPVLTLLVAAWPGALDQLRERTRAAALALGLLGALAAAAFWATAGPVLHLLYGERFTAASGSSRLLVASAGLAMLTHLGFTLLLAAGRHRGYPVVGVLGLGLTVALNAWLIPRASYDGAAVATAASQVVVFAGMWLLVVRGLGVPGLLPVAPLAGLAAAAAVAAVCGSAVADRAPWPLAAATSAAVVLAAAWAMDVPGVRRPGALLAAVRGGGR